MLRVRSKWWDYAVRDKNGMITGVRDDTPDDIKAEYEREKAEDEAFWKSAVSDIERLKDNQRKR